MTVTFIRCSDRSYQGFCPSPAHVREETDDPSFFWDTIEGTMYCTTCGFHGTLDLLRMDGHVSPPECFALGLLLATVTKEEES